jgi:hypothetical protein
MMRQKEPTQYDLMKEEWCRDDLMEREVESGFTWSRNKIGVGMDKRSIKHEAGML